MGINAFPNNVKSNYQATAPTNPRVGDVWIDSSSDIASVDLIPSKITGHNLLHNGAMQIHQRNTSQASITTSGYYTADRWSTPVGGSSGTWTQSIETDAPVGSGFRKSLKMLCTTAQASPGAAAAVQITQAIEGQNLQSVKKGTPAAEQLTLSFWVKSNKTGVYIAELYDNDNTRAVSASYTVSSSATWERKSITFPADTTGAFDNDANLSLYVVWHLMEGSNLTSGTLGTTWSNVTNANRAVGQVNLADTINNYIQLTGVQLETGPSATNYEFKDYGRELAECQRYYWRHSGATATYVGLGHAAGTGGTSPGCRRVNIPLPVWMRVKPDVVLGGTNHLYNYALTNRGPCSINANYSGLDRLSLDLTTTGTTSAGEFLMWIIDSNSANDYIAASADL